MTDKIKGVSITNGINGSAEVSTDVARNTEERASHPAPVAALTREEQVLLKDFHSIVDVEVRAFILATATRYAKKSYAQRPPLRIVPSGQVR